MITIDLFFYIIFVIVAICVGCLLSMFAMGCIAFILAFLIILSIAFIMAIIARVVLKQPFYKTFKVCFWDLFIAFLKTILAIFPQKIRKIFKGNLGIK